MEEMQIKNAVDRNCIDYIYITLNNTGILTILIPPTQEYDISFHLFVASLVFSLVSYSFQSIGVCLLG